jgi:hypothetical protein
MKKLAAPLLLAFLAATATATACADGALEAAPGDGPLGQLTVPLTTTGDDGATYALTSAVIELDATGREPIVLELPDAGTEAHFDVAPGSYQAKLLDGWSISKDGTPVLAALASVNPQDVRIIPGVSAGLDLQFFLGDDTPITGGLRVRFGVSTKIGKLSAHLQVDADTAAGASPDGVFKGLVGHAIDVTLEYTVTHEEVTFGSQPAHFYDTGPVLVKLSGDAPSDALAETARLLTGSPAKIILRRVTPSTYVVSFRMSHDHRVSSTNGAAQALNISATASTALLDAAGVPFLPPAMWQTFSSQGGTTLESYALASDGSLVVNGDLVMTGDVSLQVP